MHSSAIISPDQTYRYALTRDWGNTGHTVTWVMLNPSTADADHDDPTIRRCIGFARQWGYDAIKVVNLYALRSTDPGNLWRTHIRRCMEQADLTVAAWGTKARPDRVAQFTQLAQDAATNPVCLGLTQNGSPRHPLYVPKTTQLVPYHHDQATPTP
jgi:hypothetical protein